VVGRPRLNAFYADLYEKRRHIVVIAPAGAGKTVQAQLFARYADLPLAWLSLRATDASPSTLLASLAAAIAPFGFGTEAEVRSALRSDVTAEEGAAMLARTVDTRPLLFVLDQCETVLESPDAAVVLSTFAEYAPATLQLMSLTRTEFGQVVKLGVFEDTIGLVTGEDLRLTPEEATELIVSQGGDSSRMPELLEATDGWVAGVVFASRQPNIGPESMDLRGYVLAEVLGTLSKDEQQFLLDSSILDAVTEEAAAAIRGREGRSLYERIRTRHLPATTMTPGALVYHSVLKSLFRAELVARDGHREDMLLRRYADYLTAHRQAQEAAELYLELNDLDSAAAAAVEAIPSLYERSDWAALSRWIDLLGPERVSRHPLLEAAKVRTLYGLRHFEEARELILRLDRSGELRAPTVADPGLVATMGWALQADPNAARRIMDRYTGDYRAEAVRFMLDTETGTSPATPPQISSFGEFERLVSWSFVLQGRLSDASRSIPGLPDAPIMNPTVVLSSLWLGDVPKARSLWERVPHEIRERPHSLFLEGCVFLAEEDPESALAAIQAAIGESRRTGFPLDHVYEVMSAFVLLTMDHDDDALAVLERNLTWLQKEGQVAMTEWAQTFLGVGYLKQGRSKQAQLILEECVLSMQQAQRRLLLPLASYCLAEAESREGQLEGAHGHAALASEAASLTKSTYWLGWGVKLFPSVRDRELAHGRDDEHWRLAAPGGHKAPTVGRVLEPSAPIHLYLQPFGRNPDIFVNGQPKRLGRLKMLELVGFLSLHPNGIDRNVLQQHLFPESDQRRGGNHFRQITHKLRMTTGISLARFGGGKVIWPSNVTVETADLEFEQLMKSPPSPDRQARMEQLRAAIALAGPYLERSDLTWVDERRYRIDILREEALLELANLSRESGDFEAVRDLCESLLELDPYNESSYRLLIEAHQELGSPTSCLAVYRRAVHALNELGLTPGQQTVDLIERALGSSGDFELSENS
jgi:DNA-binding SARP family transcriptional activator